MSLQKVKNAGIRKLKRTETSKFKDHLLRLDVEERRLRFTHPVSDTCILEYATHMCDQGGVVYGFFVDGDLRASAELRKIGVVWGHAAESAFSVEKLYQNRGIGSQLMGKVITAARNRGVHQLRMNCLAENTRMQAIAQHHAADLRYESGEIVGEIIPNGPNYFSLMAEALDEPTAGITAVLELQQRLLRAG